MTIVRCRPGVDLSGHPGTGPQSRGRRRVFRRLTRDQRGVTALEYALVAPLFFMVLFLAIEVTFMLLADATLDTAANRISRMGKLGIQGDCQTAVMNTLEDTLSIWADKRNLRADAKLYHPGDSIEFENPDDEDYVPECDAGDRGDMVVYRLRFDRPGLTGLISLLGVSFFRYERIVVIQNEP